jgi:hypothetical protein
MRRRRWSIAVAGILVLGLAACGGDSDESASEEPTTTGAERIAEESAETLTDEQFSEEIDQYIDGIRAADGDFCTIVSASNEGPSTAPQNDEQARRIVEATAVVLEALAGASDDPANAAALRRAAEQIEKVAEADDFTMADFQSEELAQVFSDPALIQPISERFMKECELPDELGGPGAVPDGAPTPVPPSR